MVTNKAIKDNASPMKTVKFSTLGIGSIQESDRFPLDERGAMSITAIRFDYRTKYWNESLKTGTPVVKFNGVDSATNAPVKYFTLSSVIYKNFLDIINTVGSDVETNEKGEEWHILKIPVEIDGFQKVSTGVRGHNPYIKIVTPQE